MKLYANSRNAKAVFSEVRTAAVTCLEQLRVVGLPSDMLLSLISRPRTSPNDRKAGFPNARGLIPRYLFWGGWLSFPGFPQRRLSFQYQAYGMILCHFL